MMELNDIKKAIEDIWQDKEEERKIIAYTGKAGAIMYLIRIAEVYTDNDIASQKKDLEENMMDGSYEISGVGVKYNKGPGTWVFSEEDKFYEYKYNESGYIFSKEELTEKQFKAFKKKLTELSNTNK